MHKGEVDETSRLAPACPKAPPVGSNSLSATAFTSSMEKNPPATIRHLRGRSRSGEVLVGIRTRVEGMW